jgi:hypothetical protein
MSDEVVVDETQEEVSNGLKIEDIIKEPTQEVIDFCKQGIKCLREPFYHLNIAEEYQKSANRELKAYETATDLWFNKYKEIIGFYEPEAYKKAFDEYNELHPEITKTYADLVGEWHNKFEELIGIYNLDEYKAQLDKYNKYHSKAPKTYPEFMAEKIYLKDKKALGELIYDLKAIMNHDYFLKEYSDEFIGFYDLREYQNELDEYNNANPTALKVYSELMIEKLYQKNKKALGELIYNLKAYMHHDILKLQYDMFFQEEMDKAIAGQIQCLTQNNSDDYKKYLLTIEVGECVQGYVAGFISMVNDKNYNHLPSVVAMGKIGFSQLDLVMDKYE